MPFAPIGPCFPPSPTGPRGPGFCLRSVTLLRSLSSLSSLALSSSTTPTSLDIESLCFDTIFSISATSSSLRLNRGPSASSIVAMLVSSRLTAWLVALAMTDGIRVPSTSLTV
eukprot:CAMPEP_0173381452 /NCGR_PEP_ID=MMETSP1356-20130122/3823_1 /TAXON_ID=77927 ORGANISM="Hemiselmis virescens, Strain PCC157" /NCGR_SAMPLE_ID=MMETSP1356 /ASSEMBLY_ACC=CAM_ASM_000847 /LENGTH=112 /DNA_ID=CAMNT_0014335275 /DNA_START=251 /DNA_END=585 /DNA_ORIENTATION=+